MKSVLTIAGSDSSGGAGIQADIKTIAAHHLFAQSAITALTAQNTTGVYGVLDVPADFVAKQIDVVFDDIRPDAVKIGMVSSPSIVEAITDALVRNNARNIVVDPVMVATSGSELATSDAVVALKARIGQHCRRARLVKPRQMGKRGDLAVFSRRSAGVDVVNLIGPASVPNIETDRHGGKLPAFVRQKLVPRLRAMPAI